MKLIQFLIETSNEDRAIVSLSKTLFSIGLKAINQSNKSRINLGKISDVVDTPLVGVNDINLVIVSPAIIGKMYGNPAKPNKAVWDSNDDTIYLNSQIFERPSGQLVIAHELRHGLDDMKSNYAASESNRYGTARKNTDQYLGQPAEINARFLEVLSALTPFIKRMMSEKQPNYRQVIIDRLYQLFDILKISQMFPEKTNSRDYKRLIKRAIDYIDKEINYLTNQ